MLIKLERVTLRALDSNDTDTFFAWSCDRDVTRYSISAYAFPQSKSDITQWLTQINSSQKTVSLGICCNETGELIGYAGITSISSLNRSGEYFILIGNKEYWGRGIGTQVTRGITDYGIRTLGLHRVELTAYAVNKGAVAAYEKAGYVTEGVMREAGFRDGQFYDKVLMSVLAHQWLT